MIRPNGPNPTRSSPCSFVLVLVLVLVLLLLVVVVVLVCF
jgi:hypothetical protein